MPTNTIATLNVLDICLQNKTPWQMAELEHALSTKYIQIGRMRKSGMMQANPALPTN